MVAPPNILLGGNAPGVSSRSAEVQAYYQQFLDADGQAVANGWLTYAAAHTSLDAATAVQAYADQLAAQGLYSGVQAAAAGTSTAQTQIAQGATNGLENAAKAANLIPGWGLVASGLSGWFFRGLKIIFGGVIIIAGILKLSGKEDIVTKGGVKVAEGMLLA